MHIVLPVPDGSRLPIKGYMRFTLTLCENMLSVENFVLHFLAPDKLLDNDTVNAFGTTFNCRTEPRVYKGENACVTTAMYPTR